MQQFARTMWTALVFIWTVASGLNAFSWLKTPPEIVHACVHGTAYFPWHYDDMLYSIQMAYFRFQKKTVLGYLIIPDHQLTYYEHYGADRVGLMSPGVANVGLVLRGVAEADRGEYKIEVSSPGKADSAVLEVHSEQDLEPTIQINNQVISFGSSTNVTECPGCVLVLTTGHALPANIKLTSATSEVTCKNKTSCSMPLDISSAVDRNRMSIGFDVDYGFCDVMVRTTEVFWTSQTGGGVAAKENGDDQSFDSLPLIIGVLLGFLLCVVLVLSAVVVYLYRAAKRRTHKGRNLSTKQDLVLRTVARWRALGRRTERVRRSVSAPEGENGQAETEDEELPEKRPLVEKIESPSHKVFRHSQSLPNGTSSETPPTSSEGSSHVQIHTETPPTTPSDSAPQVELAEEAQEEDDNRTMSTDSTLKGYVVIDGAKC